MHHKITKELKENMSSFKTKTIALIASSLIVAVAGLSFATTPAEAEKYRETKAGPKSTQFIKPVRWHPNYVNKPSSAPTKKAKAPKAAKAVNWTP